MWLVIYSCRCQLQVEFAEHLLVFCVTYKLPSLMPDNNWLRSVVWWSFVQLLLILLAATKTVCGQMVLHNRRRSYDHWLYHRVSRLYI